MSSSTASARLFFALWPNEEVRAALSDRQRLWQWPAGAKPVPVDRLHITLHFLGAVPIARVAALAANTQVPSEPFQLDLMEGCCRVWPGGIAVMEWEAPPALARLHAALGDALRRFGWPVEERRYRPHVTFARHAQGAQPPGTSAEGIAWRVREGYVLVHNVPGRGYEVIHRFAA
ncbi:RNA 2',3'-cyclic phosphodiesterase [Ramlibacter humi]|uniref:RNA 2',3'-cyclic phosphodiesterase n=1 Tax=Ramlibacter humi TaxID=2530451 RepID=A0A4Z0C8F4_9BURK|nr:RNA 2',3'-cyclic phosphodiesterase [Ramlibacter humi]TFZ07966.1 RNA 2',3'-cyclic phosphodiesterase [Ramlibacter humi]